LAAAPQFVAPTTPLTPAEDLQTSRSRGWQVMPFAFRFMPEVKCGSTDGPEHPMTNFSTA
jgi:hypothetical protein